MKIEFENRPGFALPLLLIILVIASIGGISLARLSIDQLRHSTALNAKVRAIKAAESGSAYIMTALLTGEGEFEWGTDAEDPADYWREHAYEGDLWRVDSIRFQGDRAVVAVSGADPSERRRERLQVILALDPTSKSAFNTAIIGCNGATISGSGKIDSYDSNAGPYHEATAGSNADVTVLSGDLDLSGRSSIHGKVHINGNLSISASDLIGGSIGATGDVRIDGTVLGDVRTNRNFTMGNSTADIQGTTWARGNVNLTNGGISCNLNGIHYGGTFSPPNSGWCSGPENWDFLVADPNIEPVVPPAGECDPLDVGEIVDAQLEDARSEGILQSGNLSKWQRDPHEFFENPNFTTTFNPGSNEIAFHSGSLDQIFVDGDFRVGGSAEVRIVKPPAGSDGRVRLFVDGDFELGGGARFIIEDGAALEVYATGKVNLGAGLINDNEAPTITIADENGDPVAATSFVIYTSNDDADGVKIGGSAQVFASVYAPRARVEIDGSGGLYGAVRGREVNLKGSGGIHFDEILTEVQDAVIEDDGRVRVACWTEGAACY